MTIYTIASAHLRVSAAFGSAQAYRYGERSDGSAWLVTENATDEILLLGPPCLPRPHH